MSGGPLSTLLDLPFVVASRAVEAVGEATARATRVVGAPASAVVRRVEAVADDVGELVDDVGHLVDDGAELVDDVGEFVDDGIEFIGDVFEEGQDLVEDALGIHRRVWEGGDGHVQIEVRGIESPRAGRLRDGLRAALERLESVRWAEVNAITRRVAVAFDPDVTPIETLISVVEGIESAHGVSTRRVSTDDWDVHGRADHPADIEPVHRAVAILAGNSIAMGAAVAGRLTRWPRLPVELAGLASMIDHAPWARERAEALLGRRAVDLLLPLLSASANGVAQGPVGIAVDMAHQSSLLTELLARRRVWERREPRLYADFEELPDDPHDATSDPAGRVGAIGPPALSPRPIPLPPGPIEQWSTWVASASALTAGVTLIGTRRPRRAADVLLAGIPKAARLGREGFAAQLGRTLAARGVVPLDGSALRRLDRVDTIVLDSATLLTGRVEVSTVIPIGEPPPGREPFDAERLVAWADRLAARRSEVSTGEPRPERWDEPVHRNGWQLARLDGGPLPRGAKARAAEVRRTGATPLVLSHHDEPVAVVGVIEELDAGVPTLVAAIRRNGFRLIVAGRNGRLDVRLEHDGTIPAGRAMGASVRSLQADGYVVAVIAERGTTGLSAADVGVNIARPSGRPSWGGDLLCGPDLAEATFLVDACGVAAEVSRRSARFAAAGSGFGAIAAITGPARGAGGRALGMVNGAAAISLASGTWSAVELARRPRPLTPDTTPWHRLEGSEVLRRTETTVDGLSSRQAAYRQRAARTDEREAGALEPFLAELANPLNPMLAAGAGLATLVGSSVDAALVAGLIGVNTVVGGVQRLHTERTLTSLLDRAVPVVRVMRDGELVEISERELVRGDVVHLEAGDTVPADCRLLEATALEVDESNLTGESLPVTKDARPSDDDQIADRSSMLYDDTTIAAGEAVAVVVATGEQTETSRSIAAAIQRGGPPRTGVELRLREVSRQVLPIAGVAAAASITAGLLRGWPLRDVVGTGVSLAIASVPEGLPFIATAAQLASVRRLTERNAIVRTPQSIEAMGRVDVLCFDKTGTLTEGRVRLAHVSDGLTDLPAGDPAGRRVVAAALRATDMDDDAGVDLIDRAIIEAADEAGVTVALGSKRWAATGELPFESTRGLHAVHGEHADGHLISVKGAPEAILPACSSVRREDGEVEFDRASFAEVSHHVERLGSQGYRVLAVAERQASRRTELTVSRIEDLVLVGLLAFADPVRTTAADAVRGIRASGVETVMITGDHPATAHATAASLGMLDDATPGHDATARVVLTGTDLDRLDDDELDDMIDRAAVFARATPSHKVRIVEALQRAGRVVAMAGDGANDAPAIRLADVGVAMGRRGTSAARDAADLIVTDDRLETIIDALAEGRAMWGSVRSAIGILVGGNLGEIGFTVVSSLFSRRAPINARQFLLVNLVTDLAPALAVAVRPPADTTPETLLREGPESSLGSSLERDLTVRAVATAAGATAAWGVARVSGTAGRASTVGLIALVGTQLGQTLVAGGGRSPTVLATAAGSAAALVLAVQTPGLSHFFGCRPVGPVGWTIATTAATAATIGATIGQRAITAGDTSPEPGG